MSGRIGPYLNNTNLVLCLDFVNTKCYSTGLTATDLSKRNLTATMSSIVTYSNKGMVFTGATSSSIFVPKSNITNKFTINAWIKPTGLSLSGATTYLGVINSINGFSQRNRFMLTSSYNRLYFQATDGVTTYDIYSDIFTSIQNQISMVTVTYDGSFVNFYLNGVSISSSPTSFTSTLGTGSLQSTIGWGAASHDYYFNGSIYNLNIYDTGLNSDDIYSLFRSFRSKYSV